MKRPSSSKPKPARARKPGYTAVVERDGKWWIGWIEEIPGVNGQGRTRPELLASLRSALKEAFAINP